MHFVAVADWRIGTYEAWSGAVDRAGQIAADVGAESPRGPLKTNEVVTSSRAWRAGSGSAMVLTFRRS